MRWIVRVTGIVLVLLGSVWTLQGINLLRGSFMTGQPFWATLGVVLLVVGVVLCVFGWRGGTPRPRA
jgi:hypothetical protein